MVAWLDMKTRISILLLILCSIVVLCQCSREDATSTKIRLGCFPNVTHVQGLVARNMFRHKTIDGKGWFEANVPGYTEEWYTFNAGPTAMEALFGKTTDLVYVGPSPALNAYSVAAGREIRLLAGAVNGGAALMIPGNSNIQKPSDFKGKSIATPQLGNTQDVSCRAWLINNGLSCPLEGGGDCRVAPTPNAMQLQLMTQGDVDGCWTVEPWVSRLEQKAGAKILVEEPNVVTTVLAARTGWLKHHPDAAQQVIHAHKALTKWIEQNPDAAKRHVVDELMYLTQSDEAERRELEEIVNSSWKRLKLTDKIDLESLKQFVTNGQKTGLLDYVPALEGILYTPTSNTSPQAH